MSPRKSDAQLQGTDKRKHRFIIIDKPVFDLKLTPHEFAVYAALIYFANNETQEAWPSYATIANLISCSDKTVSKCVKVLETKNLIKITKRYDQKSKQWSSHLYEVLDVPLIVGMEAGSTGVSNEVLEGMEIDTTGVRKLVPNKETQGTKQKNDIFPNGKNPSHSPIQETDEPPSLTEDQKGSAPAARDNEELQAFFSLICKGSFGKDSSGIGAQGKRVGRIRKELFSLLPNVTLEQLKAAYVLYAERNPEIFDNPSKRLKDWNKFPDWIQQAIDQNGNAHAARDTDQWRTHQAMYDAYAKEFGDRYTDEQILELHPSVISTWYGGQL